MASEECVSDEIVHVQKVSLPACFGARSIWEQYGAPKVEALRVQCHFGSQESTFYGISYRI